MTESHVKIDWLDDEGRTVTCEFCYEGYIDDAWEDKPARQFYRLDDGCTCCEHCLPKVTDETEGGAFAK